MGNDTKVFTFPNGDIKRIAVNGTQVYYYASHKATHTLRPDGVQTYEFDDGVTEDLVRELAKLEPMRVVFRDNGFVADAVKINVDQIFRQLSPATDVKSI